ncbi:LOW QUALITY PROTEIN: UDP-glucuronosyltransferase 1-2-like [Spinachia spinachia]
MSGVIPSFLAGLCFLLLRPTCCSGSRILVVPVDGSHWINMELILRELHSRGHNITVLRSAKSWYIPNNSSIYTSINVTMLEDEADRNFYNEMLQNVMDCRQLPHFISTFCQQHLLTSMLGKGHEVLAKSAATMLDDPVFMKKLRDAKYDLMLTDPALTLGVILGTYLKLPMVFNVRWINSGEGHFTIAPSPVSYVPVPGSELHDRMDFLERTKNMLHYFYSFFEQQFYINPPYADLLQRHFPPGTDLDLLGHPKTRAFVAHGGTNGMYEAIYHGVPVLGLPLLFDQFDNLQRLKVRGAARVVEAKSITKGDFMEALRDILENPSYRDNIRRLSQLHRDRLMSPMDTAVFWIEYVIRNKGAAHLQSAGFHLPWYSYFCLDVAVLFVALIGVFVWASLVFCKILCCRKCRRKMKAE